MAAIDKIYGSQEDYNELKSWLEDNFPKGLKYLYPEEGYDKEDRPISNFPIWVDEYLIENCSIEWVVNYIKHQHGK